MAVTKATITFDRVFDIQRQVRDIFGSKFTLFGCESQGERHFDITVPGWPLVQDGMTVTALVGEAGNWKSFSGWVEHESREVACNEGWRYYLCAVRAFFSAAIFSALILSVPTQTIDALLPTWAKLVICLTIVSFGIQDIVNGLRSIRTRRMLEEIAASLK